MAVKLASVEDFAVRAGLGSVDDLDESVQLKAQASVEAATVYITSILRTDFSASSNVDQYYIDYDEFPFTGEFPRLFLSQGFVTTATAALVLRTGYQLSELASGTALDTSYLKLDADKGTLLITGTDRLAIYDLPSVDGNRYYMQVEYDAGFTEEADAYGFIYQNVPQYLSEAALVIAKSVFDTGVPCDSGENAHGCCKSVEAFLNRYIRFAPSALKPLS